jgi:FkbM family methyltransferase
MHFNYVDIGTCDFETSLDFANDSNNVILLVEPLTYYLDRLPNIHNVIKDNVAISNKSGTAKIYYLPDEIISIHNLPTWLRGCSSVGVKHKSAEQELSKRNLSSDLIQHKDIDIITFSELCSKHNIESIDNLKIDTEGHEQYILPDVLAKVKQGLLINHIKFENQQYLGNQILLNIIRDEFVKLNYKLVEQTDCDVLLERII